MPVRSINTLFESFASNVSPEITFDPVLKMIFWLVLIVLQMRLCVLWLVIPRQAVLLLLFRMISMLQRQDKVGFYGGLEEGRVLLDARAVVGLIKQLA